MQTFPHQRLDAVLAAIEVTSDHVPAVLIGDPLLRHDLREAVGAIRGHVLVEVEWTAIEAGWLPPTDSCLFVVDTRGLAEERLVAVLPRIADAAAAWASPIVVTVDFAAIDAVVAALPGSRTQFLCDADAGEQAAALMLAASMIGHGRLQDSRLHENEAARLQRLNEEVARIAEVLSRLSRREAAERRSEASDVFDRRQTFGARPIDDIAIEPGEIRRAIKGRRLRDQFFGTGLFEEPGWDMILDLFAAELERTQVSVSSLCIAAAVAPTTALRWISKLTEAGLFERRPDPFDRRRAYMELSERASRAMRDYVGALRRAGLSLA